ncbi:ribonuclease BN [Streptacidiphilus sp. EB129]|uniref:ribonuclease BN n=1 Tax=Streptacidiphilus sp. EB129 TaxID=3156262 RepID=UPI003513270A
MHPGRRVAVRFALGRLWREGVEMELMHRAMGFGALCFVTLVPLLIVVAAAAPAGHRGFAQWVIDGMGLPSGPAQAVQRLFTARHVLSTTSAFSLAAAAAFGLTFASAVQTGYERVWSVPAGPWHHAWRRGVWLAALTGYLLAEVESGVALHHGPLESAARIALTILFGMLFFWWGQSFLLGERVPWRRLLPGAVATMVGLVGLRGFSSLVFSPLIVTNAVSYGPVGAALIVQSWLIGVGFVIYGGPLLGRHLHDSRHGGAVPNGGPGQGRPEATE